MGETGYLKKNLANRYIYSYHIKPFLMGLPYRRLLILDSETFYSQTVQVLHEVSEWLGLKRHDFYSSIPHAQINFMQGYSEYYQEAYLELYEEMAQFFHPYNLELYDLLGKKFRWSEPSKFPASSFNPLRAF